MKKIRSITSYSSVLLSIILSGFFINITPIKASIGYDMNSLLNSVFGETEMDNTQFSPVLVEPLNLPVKPTPEDWISFTDRITKEEITLQQFSATMVDLQAELYEISRQKQGLAKEVSILDGEMMIATQKLTKLNEQEKKWEEELIVKNAELKKLKSDHEEIFTIYKLFLQKDYLRKSRLSKDKTIDVAQWLLGSNSVAEIQEANLIRQQYADQQALYLQQINTLTNEIAQKQRIAQNLYEKTKELRINAEQQKATLDDLTRTKANLLQSKNETFTQKKSQLADLEREKNASNALLQNLKKYANNLAIKETEITTTTESIDNPKTEKTLNKKPIPADLIPVNTPLNETITNSTNNTNEWNSPLKIPLKITATFGDENYEKEFGKEHLGVDFLAPQGTPLYAPKSGTIAKSFLNGYDYGYIIIDHGDETYSLYGHISAALVNEGDYVIQGQKFALTGGTPGTIGSGSWSTGAHLHLEIFKANQHVDPLSFINLP